MGRTHDCVISKVNSKLALLRHIKGCLPIETRKLFSNSHILLYMDFCSNVWGNLFLAQKRVAQTILDIKGKAIRSSENRTHNLQLLSHLNWMYIPERINYRQVTMISKSINGLAPQYV